MKSLATLLIATASAALMGVIRWEWYMAPIAGVTTWIVWAFTGYLASKAERPPIVCADARFLQMGVCPACRMSGSLEEVTSSQDHIHVKCLSCDQHYDIRAGESGPIVLRVKNGTRTNQAEQAASGLGEEDR